MANIKAGKRVVSGQVDEPIAKYIKAFADAKGATPSTVVRMILEEWCANKIPTNPVDGAAHEEAAKRVFGNADSSAKISAPHVSLAEKAREISNRNLNSLKKHPRMTPVTQ